jgi:hypothetical protein
LSHARSAARYGRVATTAQGRSGRTRAFICASSIHGPRPAAAISSPVTIGVTYLFCPDRERTAVALLSASFTEASAPMRLLERFEETGDHRVSGGGSALELEHEAEIVDDAALLVDPILADPIDRDAGNLHVRVGRLDTEERSGPVGRPVAPAHDDDPLTRGQSLLRGDPQVGKELMGLP